MIETLEQYIDPAFVYKFSHGPHVVNSRQAALENGINCVSLAHLALRDLFDYTLPSDLLCTELFLDRDHCRPVDNIADGQLGDLVWFGADRPQVDPADFVPQYRGRELVNWGVSPVTHVALHTGEHDETGDPQLLHSTNITGGNAVWPLSKFTEFPRYKLFRGVTRLIDAA